MTNNVTLYERRRDAKRADLTVSELLTYMEDEDNTVTLNALRHPNVPIEAAGRSVIRRAADGSSKNNAKNQIHPAVLMWLFENGDEEMRFTVLGNNNFPRGVVSDYIASGNASTRELNRVAGYRGFSDAAYEFLYQAGYLTHLVGAGTLPERYVDEMAFAAETENEVDRYMSPLHIMAEHYAKPTDAMVDYWLTTRAKAIFGYRKDRYSAARLNDFVLDTDETTRALFVYAHPHPATGVAFANDPSPEIRELAERYQRLDEQNCSPYMSEMASLPMPERKICPCCDGEGSVLAERSLAPQVRPRKRRK